MLGRIDEALRLHRRAVELDPLNAGSWADLGATEFFMGELDQAAARRSVRVARPCLCPT